MMRERFASSYRWDLDVLKAIAILAVVFYHVGWLATGYLGVDVFFAINGFLVLPALLIQTGGGDYQYFRWLLKRIMRLWPLVLLASAICLAVGFMGMLPDAFENLAQSVIASDLMSQNILSAITTADYWDVSNEYKPLMHFWYIGILVEFYVLMPLLLMFVKWCTRMIKCDYYKASKIVLWFLFFVSLILYFSPNISPADRFYFLPCRLFELLAGGLVGIYIGRDGTDRFKPVIRVAAILGIVLILCGSLYMPHGDGTINVVNGLRIDRLLVPQNILLLVVVLLTCCLLITKQRVAMPSVWVRGVALIGKMSFSIFVWHQILLAFYRYFIDNEMSLCFVTVFFVVTLLMSLASYYGIERQVKPTWRNFAICVVFMILTVVPAGWVYVHAGVIRDVPELNVRKGEEHRGMFAEYCDRVYAYDKDFSDSIKEDDKINVLVEGVSFGRDFANVLLESDWADRINLSYIYLHDEKYVQRYAECDFLFTFKNKHNVPQYVWDNINPEAQVYGLGTKNFGTCNGIVYQHRHDADYFSQTVEINNNFYVVNNDWKSEWGDCYIDFLQLSRASDGNIRVFTDDGKFISQDCMHLTQEGAQWFAKLIDWEKLFTSSPI